MAFWTSSWEEVAIEITFKSISKYAGRKAIQAAETEQGERRGRTWSAGMTLLDNRQAGQFWGMALNTSDLMWCAMRQAKPFF